MNKKQLDPSFSIFIVIAIVYAIGNFIWWFQNTPIVPTWEDALHFLDIICEGRLLFANAPLLPWIMKTTFFVFGKEYYDLIVIFVNYVFFLIPLYFIYKIGVELKDKETGNIAMILFSLVPAVYGMSRQYGHQDYHIIAGITFNIYCLIKTDYFRNRKWTIWYGISVGLGLMIKDAFLAYFFVPFMYVAIKGLKEKADRAKVINIIISIILGSLIAGWHYFRSDIITKVIHEPVNETLPIFEFESLRVMTSGLWELLLSSPIFIIFIIGLIFLILKYRGRYKNVILIWFFVPWAIIMFMPHHKEPEYGAGFIPAVILMCSIFLSNIKIKYIKNIIISVLIFIGILQYIYFSYRVLNICLFDFQTDTKNLHIKYYEAYNKLILYRKQDSQKLLKFGEFIRVKYCNYRLCIIYEPSVDIFGLTLQFELNKNDFYFIEPDEQISSPDVIVIFEENLTTKVKYKDLTKKIKQTNINFEKKYRIIDTYILNRSDYEGVILLGRIDKFPQNIKLMENNEFNKTKI